MRQGLLGQDLVLLAKLIAGQGKRPPIAQLAADLSQSPSQVHASLKRLERSGLIDPATGKPRLRAVQEFLLHGVKYVFPPRRGETTRGVPTAHAAPPLADELAQGDDLPPVWPDAAGKVRGVLFEPLHHSAQKAALKDPAVYELLALIDALRGGRARERQIAERHLTQRLSELLHG